MAARVLGEGAAVVPLAGPAVLVSAVAADALRLRRVLDEATRRPRMSPLSGTGVSVYRIGKEGQHPLF